MKIYYEFKGQVACGRGMKRTPKISDVNCKSCLSFINGLNRRGPRGAYARLNITKYFKERNI